jgi:hypothetical protein
MRGIAENVAYEHLPDSEERPVPWADGIRTLHVRVRPTSITRRRLIPT